MRLSYYILSIICLILFQDLHCQDKIQLTIHGNVVDSDSNKKIRSAKIELYSLKGVTLNSISDSLGYYNFSTFLTNDDTLVSLKISAEEYNGEIKTINISDSNRVVFENDIKLEPQSICWDSFLLTPIEFEYNEFKLLESDLKLLEYWASNLNESLKERLIDYNIEIVAYCSYDEQTKIAKRRGEYVKKIFVSNGLNPENFIVKKEGHKDFFYCMYCDGCHYHYLKGQGIELTRQLIKNEHDIKMKKEYSEMRRVVELRWIKKKTTR